MLEAKSFLLLLCWGFLVPTAAGLFWTGFIKNEERKSSLGLAWTLGVITMWAVFQVLAVPLIYRKAAFHVLAYTWIAIIGVLAIAALAFHAKRLGSIGKHLVLAWRGQEKSTYLFLAAAVAIILFQIFLLAGHTHTDTDDARYVVSAMEAVEKDTMLLEHPLTGEYLGEPVGEMIKDAVAPFCIFMGLFSELLSLHPAIAHHVMFPIMMIPLAYVIYWLIAKRLFPGNQKAAALFLFLAAVCHCFAYDSVYMGSFYLLVRIWQGKAVLSAVIMPLIWYFLLCIMEKPKEKIYYVFLTLTMFAACLTSSMSAIQPVLLAGTYALVLGIRDRSFRSFLAVCLCLLPNVAYAAGYYILY